MKKKKVLRIFIWVILMFLAVTMIDKSRDRMDKSIEQSLFEERAININLIMTKITENINAALVHEIKNANHFSRKLEDNTFQSMEEILEEMKNMEHYLHEDENALYLIDSDDVCYTSSKEEFEWNNQYVLEDGESSIHILTVEEVGMSEQIFVVEKFEEGIQIEGKNITHLVMTCSINILEKYLEMKEYGEKSYIYIVNEAGEHVYQRERGTELSEVDNVLSLLEKKNYLYETSVSEMKQDIRSGKSGTICANMEEAPCFIAYNKLEIVDLYTMLVVPENSVGKSTENFQKEVNKALLSFVFVVITIGAVCVAAAEWKYYIKQKELKRRLVETAKKEKEANLAKSRFLSTISHDIRTPLNSIIGITEIAANYTKDDIQLSYLEKIRMSGDDLLTLVNDILDIARIEKGKLIFHAQLVNLESFMNNMIETLKPQINKNNIDLKFEVENLTEKYVIADKVRLQQIYTNLLVNAIKYSKEEGKIRVKVWEEKIDDEKVNLFYRIEDNGIGMNKKFMTHMYELFEREYEKEKDGISGVGLGLYIVKTIVDKMSGEIHCDSEVDKGTTFLVRLPLKIDKGEHIDEEDVKEKNVLKKIDDDKKKLKILVADDVMSNWEVIEGYLRLLGVESDHAINGVKCLEKLNDMPEGTYDAIFMDMQMPVMDGIEATRFIRNLENESKRNIPIIALTANAYTENIKQCLEAGFNEHLAKPINIAELKRIISSLDERH